jgi:bifunctional DNA-binding transcriptional regulator/antitoxin component of YhaV-PrlF toxin-antitoxin module
MKYDFRSSYMRASVKGQVTIPVSIRRKYVILPDTELEFVEDGEKIILEIRDGRSPGQRLVEQLSGTATSLMTVDELMGLTRGDD